MIKIIETIIVLAALLFSFFVGVKYSNQVKFHASWLFETQEEESEMPNINNNGQINNQEIILEEEKVSPVQEISPAEEVDDIIDPIDQIDGLGEVGEEIEQIQDDIQPLNTEDLNPPLKQ